MRILRIAALSALAVALLLPAVAQAQLVWTGINYTKWLWGDQRVDGSLYNFTSIPGEGYGDNGQGTEFELLVHSKPSRYIEVTGRLKARFNQNLWTNFGGFGNPVGGDPGSGECIGGDCGEFDPRSAEYVKFRGLTVTVTPGYKVLDTVTIGSSDFGMFDPFTIGKIRYIDRDNGKGVLFQGALDKRRRLSYDLVRISLPRLWAGPNFNTGDFTGSDAAYGLQLRFEPSSTFDITGIYEYVNDIEVDATDRDRDDGRDITTRFRNSVAGLKLGIHPGGGIVDIRAAVYSSTADSNPNLPIQLGAPASFGIAGFSAVPAGKLSDETYKLNLDINPPGNVSFNFELFDIGAEYVSMMAARRESDVLLTEGHDGTWAWPGPNNVSFGVFNDGNLRIGYGGWQGNAQQVATINVDNEFTDFEEPLAETVIGWKGATGVVNWTLLDNLDLGFEYTYIDYNTNWQAWNDPSRSLNDSPYPNHESDAGVGSYRNAYAAFQDKETQIAVLRWKWFIPAGNGVEIFGKVKWIDEQDNRMTDARFLPYLPGDCPGGGAACANNLNFYGSNAMGDSFSSADWYFNPPVITVNGVTGYQWKPFDSVSDDDRELDYKMFQLGAGSQLSTRLYGQLTYEYYDVDLQDGNTAFQAYNLHEMASGQHEKNKIILYLRYIIGGAEFGFNYEYSFGTFDPDFGSGFVVQYADEATSQQVNVPVDSPGFRGRFGGWNPLFERDFEQQRLKAFMKVRF